MAYNNEELMVISFITTQFIYTYISGCRLYGVHIFRMTVIGVAKPDGIRLKSQTVCLVSLSFISGYIQTTINNILEYYLRKEYKMKHVIINKHNLFTNKYKEVMLLRGYMYYTEGMLFCYS